MNRIVNTDKFSASRITLFSSVDVVCLIAIQQK
jgi:hypothetical protein